MHEPGYLGCLIRRAAERWGEAPALIADDTTISYARYDGLVEACAHTLREKGIAPGDRVAIRAAASPAYPVLVMALIRLGAVACPLSVRLPAKSAALQLSGINSAAVVTGDVVCLETAVPFERTFGSVPLDRAATILWTSGSGGEPKAVLHTYGNHYFSAVGANLNIPLGPGDRWLLSLPLYHVGGLAVLFRAALAGATVVIPGDTHDRGRLIERHRITHCSMVPTQLWRELKRDATGKRLSCLKALLLGGGPLPSSLIARASHVGIPLFTTYGLTEMGSQVTTTAPGADRNELETAGRVLEHRELACSPDGEILVRGKTLFQGYVSGAACVPAVDPDGWFATGDCGVIDEEGRLSVTGRRDTMFISGGENVHPETIEKALCEVEEVAEAVVVSVDDAEFGRRPVAFVRMADGCDPPATILAEALEKNLSRFMIPDRFLPWPGHILPPGMKPDRAALRRLAER